LFKHTNSQLEEGLKKSNGEIQKANEIIKRLQSEMKTMKQKLRLKNVVTVQQEKLLDERGQAIEVLQNDIDSLKSNLRSKESEMEALKKEISDMKVMLEEAKKTIQDNNHGSSPLT
jgi:spindle assembly abnormal protein 6